MGVHKGPGPGTPPALPATQVLLPVPAGARVQPNIQGPQAWSLPAPEDKPNGQKRKPSLGKAALPGLNVPPTKKSNAESLGLPSRPNLPIWPQDGNRRQLVPQVEMYQKIK